jgi:hypothetical protein
MRDNIKKEVLLSIGMFSLVITIFLDRFAPGFGIIDFLMVLFTGLSAALNLVYLIRLRLQCNNNPNLSKIKNESMKYINKMRIIMNRKLKGEKNG